MLNEQEKNALLHFLSVLNDHKVKSLANSITQGRLQNKTREDAISCLLLHSESLISILNNKKCSSACLLNYLHHLKAPSPGNANKETLLQYVYSIWKFPFPSTSVNSNCTAPQVNSINQFPNTPMNSNCPAPQVNSVNQFPSSSMNSNCPAPQMNSINQFPGASMNINSPVPQVNSINQFPTTSINSNGPAPQMNSFNQFSATSMNSNCAAPQVNSFNQFPNTSMNSNCAAPPVNSFSQFSTPNMQALQYPGQNMMNQYPAPPSNSLQVFDPTPKTAPYSQAIASYQLLKEVNSLAFDEFMVNFAKMFYELLNSAAGEYLHGLNRSHFFDECKTMIMIKGGEEDIEQVGETVMDVLKLLSDLKREHQLTFNPNLTPEGVRGKTDSHGLIYAVASGTLHQGRGQLVGVFEQSFILRKDPFEQNSCKIADSTLILRSSNSVNSFSQLLLPTSKKSNERNLAIESAPAIEYIK